VWPRLECAAELRALGEYHRALEQTNTILKQEPKHLQAWLSIGQTSRQARRRDQAISAFTQAKDYHPDVAQPIFELAIEAKWQGDPFRAEELLLRAIELDPRHAQSLLELGHLAAITDDMDTARHHYCAAISAHPDAPWGYTAVAQLLADTGQPGAALNVLAAAEARQGSRPEIMIKRIELLKQEGLADRARDLAEASSGANPTHFGLWMQRFQVEKLVGDWDALASTLSSAPATAVHEQQRLHHFRGQAAEEQWELRKAISHYVQALSIDPEDPWVLHDIARASILLNDVEVARSHLKALVERGFGTALLQGRSPSMSQTHMGQLLDEYVLDAESLARLQALTTLPPTGRIAPLLEMIRSVPDYTPAAVSLLVAMRQAGVFQSGKAGTEVDSKNEPASAIPKKIAQFWDTIPVPDDLEQLMRSWRDKHHDYEYTLFDEPGAASFLAANYSRDVVQAFRRAREPAQKADLFRLAYLFAQGGHYVDADDRCLRPLSLVVPPKAHLVVYQEDLGTLGNNFIAAVPQEPVIGRALHLAVDAINRGDNDLLWLSTGPGLLARAFAQILVESKLHWERWLNHRRVLHRAELQHVLSPHCRAAYKKTERHWSRTAFGKWSKVRGSADRTQSTLSAARTEQIAVGTVPTADHNQK
jgi:mannosyltransferase OCH1-like enzyme/Flp pilus assembly protein TadD